MKLVQVVLPNDIDDPAAPSGGNAYDRRVCLGLAALGWSVREHAVPGAWPCPGRASRAALADALAALPDGALVLLDGLIASAVPEVLAPAARRLRLVVLVHMPLGGAGERTALAAAAAVVATSHWTRRLLVGAGLPAGQVWAAPPGVDAAPVAVPSASGAALLCVAAVTPGKGHDVLLAALAAVELPLRCVCVGSLDRDPAFASRVLAGAAPLRDRVAFTGPLGAADLAAAYAAADLLVLASRAETYGMVVTEALARGVPVLATLVGGLPEALGQAPDGTLPGTLVPPDDPPALAAALRGWLTDAALRDRLRRAALARRGTLTGWATTAEQVSAVLTRVAA